MSGKVLVTGAAGFIGFHTSLRLIDEGYEVVGLDNLNDYYDVNLKLARLKKLDIDVSIDIESNKEIKSNDDKFTFIKLSLEDYKELSALFEKHRFDYVINLAAQAGVRYSITHPHKYIQSNIVGYLNILECVRNFPVKHLVYASSSSVYGDSKEMPLTETANVSSPISLYAATKVSNELMASTYNHLYNLNATGVRFFTVYGPWGRPDMAIFLFTDAIFNDRPIKVFNNGDMYRDFTYVDDIVEGVFNIMNSDTSNNHQVFNIGNSKPIHLGDFISCIEKAIGREANKEFHEMQPGDVYKTYANVKKLESHINYKPSTSLEKGVSAFVDWYNLYFNIKNQS